MRFTPEFTARTESRDGVASIALTGELDIATVPVLEDHLALFEGDGVVAIMLDLRELTFLDCSALRAFLAARDRAKTNGHRLILVGAGKPARRLFELTGTEFLLDEQEAVSVLDQFTRGEPGGKVRSLGPLWKPMFDWREQEATNETVFRDMNEWTEEADDARLGLDRPIGVYLCECSDRRCTEPISLTRPEYEAVRAVPIRFAIALNHENPEIDRVLFENQRFATVEKFFGAGAKIARATNPRRQSRG